MDRRSALGVIAGMMVAPLGVQAGTPLSEKKEVRESPMPRYTIVPPRQSRIVCDHQPDHTYSCWIIRCKSGKYYQWVCGPGCRGGRWDLIECLPIFTDHDPSL